MRKALLLPALLAIASLWGCAHEEQPHRQTPTEIQAEIEKIKTDTRMPPSVKALVIGQLQGSLAKAQHPSKSGS